MTKKPKSYLSLIFLCLMPAILWGQKSEPYKLSIKGSTKKESTQISKIKYPTTFKTKRQLIQTKDSIISILKETGYWAATQDRLTIQNKQYNIRLQLGNKIDTAHLSIAPADAAFIASLNLEIRDNCIVLPVPEIKQTLKNIHEALLNLGEPFSKVQLAQINNTSHIVKAKILIDRRKKRSINNIIVKGYSKFPKSFLRHYFQNNTKKLITTETLKEISRRSKQLNFVEELKKPEILFTKDSTIVYLFLKQKKSNYFDGLVNFSTENKKIELRGTIDLQLNNTFHRGEHLDLKWRNNNKKQELNLQASVPYIFNTKLSPSIGFNLYQNDSLYSNSKAAFTISHPLNSSVSAQIIAEKETSTKTNATSTAQNFQKTGVGFGILYTHKNIQTSTALYKNTRKTINKTVAYQLHATITSTLELSNKLNIHLKNTTKLTTNDSSLENELFRSGGMNSIRGYQENAILSNSFTLFNTEIRFQTTNKAALYTIQDIGLFRILQKNELLSSLGLGYQLQRKNNLFNIAYLLNTSKQNNLFKSALISIKISTRF